MNCSQASTTLPRLIVAGIANASWPTLRSIMRTKRTDMPCLARLIETGIHGALTPPLLGGPAPWATLVTGQPAIEHGVVNGWSVREDGGGIARTGALSWRAAPVWQVLQSAGILSAAVGWTATRPAAAWPGLVIDDSFTEATPSALTDWPLPPACITPVRLRPALRRLRVHPGELDAATCGALSATALAAAAGVHAAAAYVLEHEAWRFLAVQYDLLAAHDSAEAYAFLDAMLGRLVMLAGPGTDIVIVSPAGVLIACGPGFAANGAVLGAELLDVVPTILARFGLRMDELPGRVLDGTRFGALRPIAMPKPATPPVPGASPPAGSTAARLIAGVERGTRSALAGAAREASGSTRRNPGMSAREQDEQR